MPDRPSTASIGVIVRIAAPLLAGFCAVAVIIRLPNPGLDDLAVGATSWGVVGGAAAGGLCAAALAARWTTAAVAVPAAVFGCLAFPLAIASPAGPPARVAELLAVVLLVAILCATWRRTGVMWFLVRVAIAVDLGALPAAGLSPGPAAAILATLGTVGLLVVLLGGLVHERRRRDRDRDRLEQEMDHAKAERDHEFRNVLAGLAGTSHLIGGKRTGLTGDERDRVRDAFDEEVRRLWALLDLQDVQATRPVAVHEWIDVAAAAREVADLWGVGADLSFSADDTGVWGNCSPSVLKLALTNCLANCARHAPGARVSIAVRGGRSCARIEVTDDGPGLRHDVEPGSRSGAGRSGGGRGIGLHTTARKLGRYGGTIAVRPAPTGGAQAVIEVPVIPPETPHVTFRAS